MLELWHDIRLGTRTLLKQRGFSLVVLLTLAIGVGGNVAIFSFVYGVLLQPLPYAEPERIVRLHESEEGSRAGISTLTYLDWKAENQVFARMAAHVNIPATLTGTAEPIQLRTNQVSADFFEVFGIRAALGRTFLPDDDQPGRPLVAVISDSLWRTQFRSDPNTLGRSISLDEQPHTIVGVLPGGTAIDRGYHQLWRPLVFTPQNRTRNYHWLSAVALLKPGVTLGQAQANMNAIAARIAADYPDTNKGWSVRVSLFQDGVVSRSLRQTLNLLMLAVGAVLAIAGVNVAHLFLTRGLAREREIAVRLSLGASRARLVRQFAVEGTLLCFAASALGAVLAYGLIRIFGALLPAHALPAEAEVSLNVPVLLFALGLTIVTTVLCAVIPAVRVTCWDVFPALCQRSSHATSGAAQTRLQGMFVVLQVALAFALVATAGLLIRSIEKLQRVDLGVEAAHLVTARLPILEKQFPHPDAFTGYLRQITERVGSVPGVSDAAFTTTLSLQLGGYGMGVQIVGAPVAAQTDRPFTFFKPVSPSYFQTMRLRLQRGRSLSERDLKGSSAVAVVNEAFMKKYFAERDPLGQQLLIREVLFGQVGLGSDVAWQIVGVVSDEKVGGLDNTEAEPMVYVTNDQSPQMISQILVVRTELPPAFVLRDVRAAIRSVNPNQPVTDVKTLDQVKTDSLGVRRFQSGLLAAFASLALLLAGLGIYGVLSHAVERRTRELGIRSALGATPRQLIGHVLRRGMALAGVGVIAGLLLALGTSRLMSGFVFGISARDPFTIAAGATLIAIAAWLACYLPARRAARVDPIVCLRAE